MPAMTVTQNSTYDLCIIGGGINGAGIARDAAMRGLSVALLEAGDLAGATSSSSTKLIHGGLRYLEYYEFGLVRHALQERERLLNMAPHIIWPLQFILPHDQHQRPAWMIRLGLFLYDHLAKRKKLPGSKSVSFASGAYGAPLTDTYKKGFSYADCWVEDARLVVLNAMSARDHGADIMTRTACRNLEPTAEKDWLVHIENTRNKNTSTIRAKKIVNAAGPWVRDILDHSHLAHETTPHIRLVQGSHIIVPRLYDGDHAYILQQKDSRIVFAIPYEQDFTLIGTTDKEVHDDAANPSITDSEVTYLLGAIKASFKKTVTKDDIVWTYAGVRPLIDDGAADAKAVTRDYKLIKDIHHGAPILSVFGGKITTYRVLANDALDALYDGEEIPSCRTADEPLPGGDIPNADITAYRKAQAEKYPWMPPHALQRLITAYGCNIDHILDGAQSLADLGRHFGDHIYEAELQYLIRHEWVETIDDLLWRRSKLGLHISEDTIRNIKNYLSVAVS